MNEHSGTGLYGFYFTLQLCPHSPLPLKCSRFLTTRPFPCLVFQIFARFSLPYFLPFFVESTDFYTYILPKNRLFSKPPTFTETTVFCYLPQWYFHLPAPIYLLQAGQLFDCRYQWTSVRPGRSTSKRIAFTVDFPLRISCNLSYGYSRDASVRKDCLQLPGDSDSSVLWILRSHSSD